MLRAFAFGFAQVLLGLHLERLGLRPAQIGLALSLGVVAASLAGLPAAFVSHMFGRRLVLVAAGALMCLSGIDLAFGPPGLAVLAGLTGMLGVGGLDLGPFLSIEQPMLAQTVEPDHRNVAFARYSLSGAIAGSAGALASSLATDLPRSRAFFVIFAGVGLVTALSPILLTAGVEESRTRPRAGRLDMKPLAGLASLFALDSLGGGFVTTTLVAYWLHIRFGADAQALGPTFAAASLLQAGSYEVAGWLGNRIGLIRTMVFTNVPASLLLGVVPFSPSLNWALVVILARYCISDMDVPVRQAYVVSIVPSHQRSDAIALTSATRGLGLAVGPTLAGLSIQAGALAVPFFIGGGLKVLYNLALYTLYRSRHAEHETIRQ